MAIATVIELIERMIAPPPQRQNKMEKERTRGEMKEKKMGTRRIAIERHPRKSESKRKRSRAESQQRVNAVNMKGDGSSGATETVRRGGG